MNSNTGMAQASATQELTIDSLAFGADAVAHTDAGKTVFVAGGVPGDSAEIAITEERERFDRGQVVRIIEPSKERVEPACPYAGVCGGCPWAAVSYPAQAHAKVQAVRDALIRIAHFDAARVDSLVAEVESPGSPWGYRNKIELAATYDSHGRLTLGMHGCDGASVIKVDRCQLLVKRYQGVVRSVAGALNYLAGRSELGLERVGIRASERTREVELALWTPPSAFPRAQVAQVLGDACPATSIVRVITKQKKQTKSRNAARQHTQVERLAGAGSWAERVGRETLHFSAPSFFQVNTAGAEALITRVLDVLQPQPADVCWDLYSGAGTFTLPLARSAGYVCAIESAGSSVRDLRRNIESAGLENVEITGGNVVYELPDVEPNLIVVDPPRAGLDKKVVETLSHTGARAICYVSCDPATLARDLARFEELGHYHATRIYPVDQFPQTFHVETVTLLSKTQN